VAEAWELPPSAAFEVDLDALFVAAPDTLHYEDVTPFPAVHRDLAIVVPEGVRFASVADLLAAPPLVESVQVFDVYRGPQVGEGRKSLAVHVSFRAPDRTLTDEEVNLEVTKLTARISNELDGELRA
jgi:phenylalanyl-tRNA synthetase beta chain